jgi:superoxide dismutase, Fe-Mn family
MAGPFALAPLPWNQSDLEPVISSRRLGFHCRKHHKTYVDALNKLADWDFAAENLGKEDHAVRAGAE